MSKIKEFFKKIGEGLKKIGFAIKKIFVNNEVAKEAIKIGSAIATDICVLGTGQFVIKNVGLKAVLGFEGIPGAIVAAVSLMALSFALSSLVSMYVDNEMDDIFDTVSEVKAVFAGEEVSNER